MALVKVDEQDLVLSHRAGDVDAFPEIVRTHYGALLGHAMRRLQDRGAAEDAVQETFLRAYRALPGFGGDFRLAGWLHRILSNVCADEAGRRARSAEAFGRVAADYDAVTPDLADAASTRAVVTSALAMIPAGQREALLLREVEGLDYQELALAAGITEENARARVHRARSALRRILTGPAAVLVALLAILRRGHAVANQAAQQSVAQVADAGTLQLAASTVAVASRTGAIPTIVSGIAAAVLVVAPVGLSTGGPSAHRPTHPAAATQVRAGVPSATPMVVTTALDDAALDGAAAGPAPLEPTSTTAAEGTTTTSVDETAAAEDGAGPVEPAPGPDGGTGMPAAAPAPSSPAPACAAGTMAAPDLAAAGPVTDAGSGALWVDADDAPADGSPPAHTVRALVYGRDGQGDRGRLQMTITDAAGTAVTVRGRLASVADNEGLTTYRFEGVAEQPGTCSGAPVVATIVVNASRGTAAVTVKAPEPASTPPPAPEPSAPTGG